MGTSMRKPKNLTATISATVAAVGVAIAAHAAVEQDQHADHVAGVDDLRSQVAALTAERDDLKATLDGQYDVNADYADQIADLTDQLADAQQAHGLPKFYEDGSWVMGEDSGCAPSALCDDEYQESLIKDVPSHLATWSGFRVGEVILCPKGWTVSTDDAEDGQTWAACM